MTTVANNLNKQLFQELNDEMAANLSGGIRLTSVECIDAGDEPITEPYIKSGDSTFWRGSLKQGQAASVNKTIASGTKITLYESDSPYPGSRVGDLIVPGSESSGEIKDGTYRYRLNFA